MSGRTGERYWRVSEDDKLRRIEMIDNAIQQHYDIIEGYEAERSAIERELIHDPNISIGESVLRAVYQQPEEAEPTAS